MDKHGTTGTPDLTIRNTLDAALQRLQGGDPLGAYNSLIPYHNTSESIRDLHYITGLCLLQLGKYPEGCQALQNELARFPQNTQAFDLLEKCREAGLVPIVIPAAKVTAATTQTPVHSQPKKQSELDFIIPPEVKNDEFYHTIIELTQREPLTHVLEIGSSSGGGSTEAFVLGLGRNPRGAAETNLYCMELSKPRFEKLRSTYAHLPYVKCFNVSSVPLESFPKHEEVERFYKSHRTPLNQYPLEQVLGWLTQDIEYVEGAGVPTNGIQLIKQALNIVTFDMVLIDGSEFTGKAELKEVIGATWILLDDTCVFKNFENYQALLRDPNYTLYRENQRIRNGFAVFRRV